MAGHRGRQPRIPAGGRRSVRHTVKVTGEQEVRLQREAAREGVSVSRLLLERALAGDGWTPTQRRALIAEWERARRKLDGVSTNVNQIAMHANAQERFPGVVAYSTLPQIEEAIARLNAAIEELRRP